VWCWILSWWVLLVFRSDCKVFGCISSKSEQNWCFELLEGYLAFELVLYIILYIIIHILLYYTLHIYYIIYYTILFLFFLSFSHSPLPILISPSSSDLSLLMPNHNIHSILVGTYIYLFIFNHLFFPISPTI
jgi:hypothetical protein